MSIPVKLQVRIETARSNKDITRDLRSLSFRSVAPGGFASATLSLDRPLDREPDDVAYYARVKVIDKRNGRVVWEGRLEDPGRSAGDDGEVWQLTAMGPSAHTSDRKVPLVYVDTSLERWESNDPDEARIRISNQSDSEGVEALRFTLQRDTQMPTGLYKMLRYLTIDEAAQKLARVSGEVKSGTAYSALATEILTRTGTAGAADTALSQAWATGTTAVNATTAGTITNGRTVVEVRLNRTSSTLTVADDSSTSVFRDVAIQAMRYTADGTEIVTGYTVDYVFAHSVVNDLLGRLLTEFDGAGAEVDASATHQIDQLVYPDGITAAEVLDDLMLLEPAYYWAAWESNSDGKHRFEWKLWPTTVRYEADVRDGYESTGSADGLFNACSVRWRTRTGRPRRGRATRAVKELDDAGLVREELIDLGDENGSFANAERAAAMFLQEHEHPPNAGVLTLARPILDVEWGRMVEPWEVLPGQLIRVRGVQPNVNSLNPTVRDGVTVFKIVGTDFDTSTGTARLELDSYPRTVARALAELKRRRTRKR